MDAYKEIHTEEQNRFSFSEMYSTESLQKQLEHGEFFVLSNDQKDVGYLALYRESPAHWMLDKLYILPDCKGKGYGRMLVEHAINYIGQIESGTYEILLNVNRRNRAVSFYQHLGFEITSSWDRVIADGRWLMDGYEMRKTIFRPADLRR